MARSLPSAYDKSPWSVLAPTGETGDVVGNPGKDDPGNDDPGSNDPGTDDPGDDGPEAEPRRRVSLRHLPGLIRLGLSIAWSAGRNDVIVSTALQVLGLSGLIGSGVGLVGALVALVAIAPLLIPLLVLVILPAWLAASRRGEAFYELFWKMTGWSAGSLSEAGRYLDDYLAFVALLPEVEAARPRGAMPPRGFRQLRVRDVTFTYPTGTEPALHEVSLDVAAGEVVALVGENGSGKTTLAKLLAGLYHPDSGTITWDGVDVSTVDPNELRRSIAVIFQDFERFHLTAGENIGIGRVSAVDDTASIRAAAAQAGADRFIEALKKGYATMLGPEFTGGTDLSVGQWQRMALARAFFRSAPFVILDEPTAALDPRAEQELFDRIRSLLAERTVLIISHRFSSVRSADRTYVLEGGRVTESGDHDTLLALGGRYAELFTLQAAAYQDAPADRMA